MGRLSARSNPTGIKEIDRTRIALTVQESNGLRGFTLDRLDLEGMALSSDLQVLIVARAGNTTARYELGAAAAPSHELQPLDGIAKSHPLSFRVLLRPPSDPRIAASAENIRPRDESQSNSLLPMEPADLGQRLWRLVIGEEGPVLQFNAMVFPSAAGAENFLPFRAFVLPEALRQVLAKICEDPSRLEDETDVWSVWKPWLAAFGADAVPAADTEYDEKQEWCDDVVGRFCNRFEFANRLHAELLKGGAVD